MSSDDISKRLEALPPEARARVETALVSSIEAELAGTRFADGSFSRGVLFSKSGASRNPEEYVLPALARMDTARFEQFAGRLSELRKSSGSQKAGS